MWVSNPVDALNDNVSPVYTASPVLETCPSGFLDSKELINKFLGVALHCHSYQGSISPGVRGKMTGPEV